MSYERNELIPTLTMNEVSCYTVHGVDLTKTTIIVTASIDIKKNALSRADDLKIAKKRLLESIDFFWEQDIKA